MSPVDGAPEATLRSFRDACCFRSPRTKRSRGRSDSCATGRAFGSSLVCRRSRAPGIRAASTARGPGRVVGSRSGVGSLIHPGSWRSASLARDRRRSVVVSWTGSRRGSRSKGRCPRPRAGARRTQRARVGYGGRGSRSRSGPSDRDLGTARRVGRRRGRLPRAVFDRAGLRRSSRVRDARRRGRRSRLRRAIGRGAGGPARGDRLRRRRAGGCAPP